MHARDSIDDYLMRPKVLGARVLDAELEIVRNWCHGRVALDFSTDDPIPRWALNVMKLDRLPFRARIEIIKAHNRKINKYREIKDEFLSKKRKERRAELRRIRGQEPVGIDLNVVRGLII